MTDHQLTNRRRWRAGATGLAVFGALLGPVVAAPLVAHAAVPPGVFAYVTNNGANDVSVIDTSSNGVTTGPTVGPSPDGVAFSPDGSLVWVVGDSGSLQKIDRSTNTATSLASGSSSLSQVAASPDGTFLVVTDTPGNHVLKVSTGTGTVVALATGITGPAGVAISPDSGTAYVADQSGAVTSINIGNGIATTIAVLGGALQGLALSPDGSKVFVANSSNGTLATVPAGGGPAMTVNVGAHPYGVAVAPTGRFVYVTNEAADNVSVVDTLLTAVAAIVPVGHFPKGIALTPDGSHVYVANSGSSPPTVSVITTGGVNTVATVNVGTAPTGIAIGGAGTAKTATSTTLTSTPNPSTVGQPVTFTATVTPASGPTPSGTVTFQEGSTVIGTASVDASGHAVLTTSALTAGTHQITAVYGGDPTHTGSTSNIVSQVVNAAATDIKVKLDVTPHLGIDVPYLQVIVTAENRGPVPVTSAAITSTVPAGLTATATGDCSGTILVTCTFGAIGVNDAASRAFIVPLDPDVFRVDEPITARLSASVPDELVLADNTTHRVCDIIGDTDAQCG